MSGMAGFPSASGGEDNGQHQQPPLPPVQQPVQAAGRSKGPLGGDMQHMLTHTPPCRYEDPGRDMGKRQKMYMSPGLWSVLDTDPTQGFAMMDTRPAAASAAALSQPQRPPVAWGGETAAKASTTAMDDDSPSRFFYVSPTEEAARLQSQAQQGKAAAPGQHSLPPTQQPAATGRAATTDDVVASTYRPVLMTGTTPNSTSSIFCRNTVCNPDADQIILCMSSVLQVQMLHDEGADPALRAQFAFMDSPPEEEPEAMMMDVGDGGSGTGSGGEVTVEEVHRFIEGIFTRGRFSAECNIIALVYINRVISTTAMPLHRGNWKALVLVALLLAQKVWNDKSVPLSSVAALLPQPAWALDRIRGYERRFLELLQYRATVTQALYTRYYFELRSLYEKLLEQENISREFPLKPLALWQARKLELCSDSFGLCQRQPQGASTLFRSNTPNHSVASSAASARPPRSSGSSQGQQSLQAFQPTSPLTPFTGGEVLASGATAASAAAAAGVGENTGGTGAGAGAAATRSVRGVAVMSPYSPIPQSPSLTYEDIVYQPKGRYVLG